jgi:hypothetical protein
MTGGLKDAATQQLSGVLTKRDIKRAESRKDVGCGNCAITDIYAMPRKIQDRGHFGESLPILSLYTIVICVVAAVLYVAVNKHEPNRRLASALKLLIATGAFAPILGHLMR